MAKSDAERQQDTRDRRGTKSLKEVRGIYAKEEHKKTVQRAAQDHSKRLREGE